MHVTPEWQAASGGRFRSVNISLSDHPVHTGGPLRGISARIKRSAARPTDSDQGEQIIIRSQPQRLILPDLNTRLWLKSELTQFDANVRLSDPLDDEDGLPPGGLPGQIIVKQSAEENDAAWVDAPYALASSFAASLTFESLGLRDDGTDQRAAYLAALTTAAGRPIDGQGRTYSFSTAGGAIQVPSTLAGVHIRNTNFQWIAPIPDLANARFIYFAPTVDPTKQFLKLRNCKFDMGTNKYFGDSGNTSAINTIGGKIDLEDVEITGNFRGNGMLILNAEAPRVVRPYIHDCIYRYPGDPSIGEQFQALRFNGCKAAYLADPHITHLGGEHQWITGEVINTTRGLQYRWYGNNGYKPTTNGTTGATPPTHISGTVSDGGVSWLWIGPAEASVRWVGGGLVAGVAEGLVVQGGLVTFVGEGIDVSGGATIDNADIVFHGTRFEDCDSYGFKLAHTHKRCRLYSVQSIRSGIHNFTFGGSTGADIGADVRCYDCYSLNPGMPKRWNDTLEATWPTSLHYGFTATGTHPGSTPRGKIINSVAIDDQASPTMNTGFSAEGNDGNWELEDCYASGFITAESAGFKTIGMKKKLLGSTNLFVRPGGNDNNPGFLNNDANALATIQAAVDRATSYDLNGKVMSINIADGTYTGAVTVSGLLSGQKQAADFIIKGNAATPGNVHINVASGGAFTITGGARVHLQDMKISAAAGNCIDEQNHSACELSNIQFGVASLRHISIVRNSRVIATGNYEIVGNAISHILAQDLCYVGLNSRTVTLNSALAFTTFLSTTGGCSIRGDSLTFTGAGVAGTTGKKYDATFNSVIRGTPVFPGDVAGTTGTGGQYA